MPKIESGRLDGLEGMNEFSAAYLFALANKLEAQIHDPSNADDPKWLQRWADKLRRLAEKKATARESKRVTARKRHTS